MSDTLFAYFKGTASNADDTDPETSSSFYNPPISAVHNVVSYTRETVRLDAEETLAISIAPYTGSAWVCIMARVVGEAKLTITGDDWDGSTPISSVTAGYGTSRYPGYISIVTNDMDFELEGIADGTIVEYLVARLVADNQL